MWVSLSRTIPTRLARSNQRRPLVLNAETKIVAGAPTAPPLLRVEDVAKAYGGVQALKGVSLSVRHGEVHGLVGANGAGKSTLIKILAGLAQPDRGRVMIEGSSVEIATPHRATELGMNFIHQELA